MPQTLNVSLIETLLVLMVVTSLLAVELQNLKRSAQAYCVQALLICGVILAFAPNNPALYSWAIVAFLAKAVIIPYLLLRFIKHTSEEEVQPLLGFGPSVIIASLVLMAFFKITHYYVALLAPTAESVSGVFRTNLAISLTVFVLGLYAILSRRDAIKTVIGLCLLENAVHLSLVSLAPRMRETALIGIATEVVISVYLLLYVIRAIRQRFGTTDTHALSELQW
jgi:hydrogenase-4 component E